MRKASIRRMLLVALLVPIFAVAFTSGLAVRNAGREAAEVAQQTDLALAAGGPTTLITALMDERNITGLELIGLNDAVTLRVDNSADAREGTDARLAEFRSTIANSDTSVRSIYGTVASELEVGLVELRESVDSYDGPRDMENMFADTAYNGFTDLVLLLHEANDAGISEINDAELRNRARSIASQSRSADRQSQIARFAALSVIVGVTPDDMVAASQVYAGLLAAQAEAIEMLADDRAAQRVVTDYYGRPNQDEMKVLVEDFLKTQQTDPAEVIAAASDEAPPNAADAWNATRASITSRADEMHSTVNTERRSTVVAFVLSVASTIAVALIAARALARPLIRLADQAHEMAASRLPDAVAGVLATPAGEDIEVPELDPITGSSVAEVAEVAAALNSVQDRALDLAVEQAGLRRNISDSLLNMGRRVQTLVTNQLHLITDMEGAEEDPDGLAELYRLDHLATRIRRNAESLVVLAEQSQATVAAYGTPVPLLEVLRSAISEVDGYERVDITVDDTYEVSGSVAGPLAHIIAELTDNGLYFSPPDTHVTVVGLVVPGGLEVQVVDLGVGMSADAIEAANRRLAGTESFTVAPSKYLGHYVAGALAHRIGVLVSLGTNYVGGVTAKIGLPSQMLHAAEGSQPAELGFTQSAKPTSKPASKATVGPADSFDPLALSANFIELPAGSDRSSSSEETSPGAAPVAVLDLDDAAAGPDPEPVEFVELGDGDEPEARWKVDGQPPSLASLLKANRSVIASTPDVADDDKAPADIDPELRRDVFEAAKRHRSQP